MARTMKSLVKRRPPGDGAGEVIVAGSRRLRRDISDIANSLVVYRMAALAGGGVKGFRVAAKDLRTPDRQRGAAILEGRFTLGGETLEIAPGTDLWREPVPSRRFAALLHSFDWLADLLAVDGPEAMDAAQGWLDRWIVNFGRWNWFVYDPAIAARRVRAWLLAGPDLFDAPKAGPRRHRLHALSRQVKRLRRGLPLLEDRREKLHAALTLTLAWASLGLDKTVGAAAARVLSDALKTQILPDGGHISRNPEAAGDALIDLAILEAAAEAAGTPLPEEVRRAYDRLAAAVCFFRHADGGLASFHGGGEGDPAALNAALARGEPPQRAFGVAPHSGFHRAEAGGSIVLLDVGGPPPGAHGVEAHASALAMEVSTPGGRLVVNCGWSIDHGEDWRSAVRGTAAHSTLTLEETSSARVIRPGFKRTVLGPRLASLSDPVKARRHEAETGVWLEAAHDGYRRDFGLSLRRRVFLAADGGDLRGEDSLYRPVEDGAPTDPSRRLRFSLRFHLHPDVRASLARDFMSALLVFPNGDGWRFRTDGGPVRLEPSVYLAAGAPPRRTKQLVLTGEAEPFGAGDKPPNRVRWAFQRLGRLGAAGGA